MGEAEGADLPEDPAGSLDDEVCGYYFLDEFHHFGDDLFSKGRTLLAVLEDEF